jgi:hypothetical protein
MTGKEAKDGGTIGRRLPPVVASKLNACKLCPLIGPTHQMWWVRLLSRNSKQKIFFAFDKMNEAKKAATTPGGKQKETPEPLTKTH